MKNRIICFAVSLMMLVGCVVLCSCSEADKVNRNISKQANYFEAERRITVYNARTDNVILEMEGAMSISNNENNELVCTVKTGPNEYKKNYIYLNEYTMYVVEDITGTHTDPYHYKLYFHTDIYVMIARKHEIPPQKVESSIRSAICEINKEMGMHFTPMTYIHIVALGEKYRKKMMKAK